MQEKIKTWNTVVDFIQDAEVAEIVFKKKDGSIRTMICTRSTALIPVENHPKGPPKEETKFETVSAYDIEAKGWRSFRIDSIITKKKVKERNYEPDKL